MKLGILPIFSMVIISLLFSACSPASGPAAPIGTGGIATSVSVLCDEFRSQPHRIQALNVPAGSTFTVILCSDAISGIQWSASAQVSDPAVVQQINHAFTSLQGNAGVVGATGNDVWTFTALKRGTSTITMGCIKPREHGMKGDWVFDLSLVVK